MTTYNWEKLLQSWNRDILTSGEYRSYLPAEVIASGWLGFPGASEAQIEQAERRLKTKLPPSYREFLKITNGWRMTTPFIWRLWPTEEIEWFSVRRPDWVRSWEIVAEFYSLKPPPELAYMTHLKATLEISDEGDSAIYLLNPLVISPDGEWEAWFFASWLAGAERYSSFWELMLAEYENFLRLKED